MRCGSCGALFQLKEYATTLDDLLEEYLGSIPCNRI
ncbi:dual CXXC motif small (seleno)protein [Desulfomicrobium orale]